MARKRKYERVLLQNVADEVAHCLVRGDFSAVAAIQRVISYSLDDDRVRSEMERYYRWLHGDDIPPKSADGLMEVYRRS